MAPAGGTIMQVIICPRKLYFSGKISEFRRWLSWYAWEQASLETFINRLLS